MRRRVLLGAAAVGGIISVFAAVWPAYWQFYAGVSFGAAITFYLCVMDEPPEHIDRWRRGSDGERRTAKALRALRRGDWTVRHDLQTERSNRDHVVIGSAGAFLLDSKAFGGDVKVEAGVLKVSWREDPDDGYELPYLGRRMRGAAARLADDLRRVSGARAWVHPVVVIWAPFAQTVVEQDGVTYVRGEGLVTWLESRPAQLHPGTHTAIATALSSEIA